MRYEYDTRGTCSKKIYIAVENGKIISVSYQGGCPGSLQGISSLVEGMEVDEVIAKLSGIRCGFKTTSCPDQLAEALRQLKQQ